MKTIKVILAVLACFSFTFLPAQKVLTGIEVLKKDHFKILQGKRVGLITNPTGVDARLKSTVDILNEAPGVQLVALYGPEHGVRGNIHAGDRVENYTDEKTGLPVYSIYGETRKPTPEMLEGIDVLVYDIQDIGCRSFTFISSMGLAMQAAAENGKEFVVLDRPNPLGGNRIEGCLTEDPFISFVSQFKIPYLYGLTCGELARLLNEENYLGTKCKLTVVPMKKWKRKMTYQETGLPWVAPSPHIPQPASAFYYPATGILGELYCMSIGVGYTLPFQLFATDSIDAESLADRLNRLNLSGVLFRPIYIKPFYSTGKGENYSGVQIYITDPAEARLTEIQFYVLQELHALYPEKQIFSEKNSSRFSMFDKVCGSDQIRKRFSERMRVEDMLGYWQKDESDFRKLAKKYYMY